MVGSYYVHFACSSVQVVYPRQPDLSSLVSVSRTVPLSEVMSWQCTFTATALAVAIVGTLLATMQTAPQSLPANGLTDNLARSGEYLSLQQSYMQGAKFMLSMFFLLIRYDVFPPFFEDYFDFHFCLLSGIM